MKKMSAGWPAPFGEWGILQFFRAILGIVDLVDILPLVEALGHPWAEGPARWVLRNPRLLWNLSPYLGGQRLFGDQRI